MANLDTLDELTLNNELAELSPIRKKRKSLKKPNVIHQ